MEEERHNLEPPKNQPWDDSSIEWPNVWEPLLFGLTKMEAENILRRALESGEVFPEYEGFDSIECFDSIGYYKVFETGNMNVDDDLTVRMPVWISELMNDNSVLNSQHACNAFYLRTIYVITCPKIPNSTRLNLVCWQKNEAGVQFSGVEDTFNKNQYRAILDEQRDMFFRPNTTLPHFLMDDPIYNNYFFLIDSSVFTPNFEDGGSWICRGKDAQVVTTTSTRRKTFKDTENILIVKENTNVHLPIKRKVFYWKDQNGNVASCIGVQYITNEVAPLDLVGLRSREPNMNHARLQKCQELLSNRTVGQAYQESVKEEHGYTKRQLYNASRKCTNVMKTRYGPKPIDIYERDQASAFVPSSNVEMVVRKDRIGRTFKEVFSVFENAISLFLNQATSVTELQTLRRHCKVVEEMTNRKEQHEYIKANLLRDQDSSGFLHSATIMMVDTTFGLNKTHVVTLVVGQIRGFRTRASKKPRLLILSLMGHQKKSEDAHDRHVHAFQNVLDNMIESNPKLKDRRVTALITDGEKSLPKAYCKLSICEEAQVLGCAYHKRKNLLTHGLQENEQVKLWGSRSSDIYSGAVLSALNMDQYERYLSVLESHLSPSSYYTVMKQGHDLFNRFSLINKLKGGVACQYATTNHIESLNRILKVKFPGPVQVGILATTIREMTEDHLHEMTRAATTESSIIICERPIRHWNRLTDELKDKELAKHCLLPKLDSELAYLNSLFVGAVGSHTLNEAIQDKRKKTFEVFASDTCVFVCEKELGKAARTYRVQISKECDGDELSVLSLKCDGHKCKRSAKFCKHRLQAFFCLSSEERDCAVHSFLERETSADFVFRKEQTSKAGHKPGKRTFKPCSYPNRPRTIREINDQTFLEELSDEYESNSSETEESLCEENSDIDSDAPAVNNHPQTSRHEDYSMEITDMDESHLSEVEDHDASIYLQFPIQSPRHEVPNGPKQKKSRYRGFIDKRFKELKEDRRKEPKTNKGNQKSKSRKKVASSVNYDDINPSEYDDDDAFTCRPNAQKYLPKRLKNPKEKPNRKAKRCNDNEEIESSLENECDGERVIKKAPAMQGPKRRGRPPAHSTTSDLMVDDLNVSGPADPSQSMNSGWNQTVGPHMISIDDSQDSNFFANDAWLTDRNTKLRKDLEIKLQRPLGPPKVMQNRVMHEMLTDPTTNSALEKTQPITRVVGHTAKRRGRPPKSILSTRSSQNNQSTAIHAVKPLVVDTANSVTKIETAVRKRGRPPKNNVTKALLQCSVQPSLIVNENSSSAADVCTRRKRGRPSKDLTGNDSLQNIKSTTVRKLGLNARRLSSVINKDNLIGFGKSQKKKSTEKSTQQNKSAAPLESIEMPVETSVGSQGRSGRSHKRLSTNSLSKTQKKGKKLTGTKDAFNPFVPPALTAKARHPRRSWLDSLHLNTTEDRDDSFNSSATTLNGYRLPEFVYESSSDVDSTSFFSKDN